MNTQELQLIPQPRAQELLGVSAMTLWRWQKAIPDFPNALLIRGRKYFKEAEIAQWIEAKQQASVSEITPHSRE